MGPIWKIPEFEHKYCNELVNLNYKMQYCIIGLDTLHINMDKIKLLYEDTTNDFLLLDKNNSNDDILCRTLDFLNLSRIKCYSMDDCSDKELINYFILMYKSCNYFIFERD